MKINYWMWLAVILAGALVWTSISGPSAKAQYGQATRITKLTGIELANGPVNVQGDVKGFSCIADVDADLIKGDGIISSKVECYVLTR